jgi:hypothetical protein
MRRRHWLTIVAALGALVVAAAIRVATSVPLSSDALRARVVATLAAVLDADVELRTLTLRIFPRFHATGEGLTVRFERRRDVPPLISVDRFAIDTDLVGLWRRRIASVVVTGLAINIPPDRQNEGRAETSASGAAPSDRWAGYAHDMVIERLDAPDSQLTILRGDPEKQPRVWYMHQLRMFNIGPGSAIPFETLLTNAVPPGQIAASGHFGPWARREPGSTPLDGRFAFDNADLSVFNGISGVLSARGTFGGTLERIAVAGETDTPDFMVNLSGHQVALHTTYHAVVDATNGDTSLDPVTAIVADTKIVAKGGVYEVEGVHGRVIKLDVAIEDGRLEDVMRLSVRTPRPPMTGRLGLTTLLTIPPGQDDVVDRLQLDGRFAIETGRFTDASVQARLNDLSRRASGRKAADTGAAARVTSAFAGRFVLSRGRLSMRTLVFDVPGAVVSLNGEYALRQQTLAFDGDLVMDAKISQTTTGFKSLLLKMADPLFLRNGKTVVPLKISGTRNDPQFGLDMGRVFRH